MLLAIYVYWPGLNGGFLFDDFANLPALSAPGPIDNWFSFWRYITSGTADPTGRPLTLLTFLIDARNWPAAPLPFKRTNLILHVANGLLLFALLNRLGSLLNLEITRCRNAALLGASFWLLHPLWVSTTLYIVQREAMLPATCVLAGLLIWLHGRERLVGGHLRSGLIWSVLGLGGFTVLGVLSKANGILLPCYALVIEAILLGSRRHVLPAREKRAHRLVIWLFAIIPTMGICLYLVRIGATGILHGGNAGIRSWTYAQRLLTEPRVVMDYLSLLWLPRPFSSGLFNDQYAASTSLIHPLSTLWALLAVVVLISGAWWFRRRYTAWSLAVLFFFAGHLLESTSVPLELYFEHRNYVPALLMFWPLGLWLADTRKLKLPKQILMIALPLGLALMTHARATVWGNVRTQALVWAQINPDSPRAQANAAQILMQSGQPKEAAKRLQALLATKPDESQLAFNLIGAHCLTGGITQADIDAARVAMQGSANTGSLFAHWFERTLPVAMAGSCPGLTPEVLLDLINAGLQNPRLAGAGRQQDLVYLRGSVALARHQADAALLDFRRALDLQVRPALALKAAAALGSASYPRQGLQLLDHYEQVKGQTMPARFGMPMLHEWVLSYQHYWPNELTHLRHQLNLDARAANVNTGPSNPDRGVTR
ncbi:tetratricopeptide repeat protein [Rhodanobacter fulvus]|uniref:tetratricopeptide repeat protein n=1 Tax=Rhodanobacter fulvus TaxID=219571 RepID=UPI001ED9352B|nr:tetratricopeptide repeat protein [Rhodanobacter fulvus]